MAWAIARLARQPPRRLVPAGLAGAVSRYCWSGSRLSPDRAVGAHGFGRAPRDTPGSRRPTARRRWIPPHSGPARSHRTRPQWLSAMPPRSPSNARRQAVSVACRGRRHQPASTGRSSTAEVGGRRALPGAHRRIAARRWHRVETAIVHAPRPGRQIVQYASEIHPDLIIMGAHGHRRLKDLIFGNTINPVRHELRIPLLIVKT